MFLTAIRELELPIRNVEFDEIVLGLVKYHLVKVLRDERIDWILIPIYREFFREQIRLLFAIQNSLTNVLMFFSVKSIESRLYLVISSTDG